MIEAISKETLEQGQAELRKQIPAAPAPVNLQAASELAQVVPLVYRGQRYVITPLSYTDGVKLQMIMKEIDDLKYLSATLAAGLLIMDVLRRSTVIMAKYMVPVGIKPKAWRVLRGMRLARNPLRSASEGEIGVLLGFFLLHRQTSSVKL